MKLSPVLYITKQNDECLKANSEVFHLIAEDQKPRTIGTTSVLPAV